MATESADRFYLRQGGCQGHRRLRHRWSVQTLFFSSWGWTSTTWKCRRTGCFGSVTYPRNG